MGCEYGKYINDLLNGKLMDNRMTVLYEHAKECSECSSKLKEIEGIDSMMEDALNRHSFVSNKGKIMDRVEKKRASVSLLSSLYRFRKAAYAVCIILIFIVSIQWLRPLFMDTLVPTTPNEATDKTSKGITDEGDNNSTTYKNEKYGFSLDLPESWKGKYFVEENGNVLNIYNKEVWDKQNGAGKLFTISAFRPKDKWDTEGKELEEMIGLKKFYEDNDMVLGYSYPTDVQYFLDDSALKGEYEQMKKDVEQVIKTVRKLK